MSERCELDRVVSEYGDFIAKLKMDLRKVIYVPTIYIRYFRVLRIALVVTLSDYITILYSFDSTCSYVENSYGTKSPIYDLYLP